MAYDPVTQATLDDLQRRRAAMQAGPEAYAQFWMGNMPQVQNPAAQGSPQTVADWTQRVGDPTSVGYQPFVSAGLTGGVGGMADWLRQNWYPQAQASGQVSNPLLGTGAAMPTPTTATTPAATAAPLPLGARSAAITTTPQEDPGGTTSPGPTYYNEQGQPYANQGFSFWQQPEGWYQGDPNAPEGSNISFVGTQAPWQTATDASSRAVTPPAITNRGQPATGQFGLPSGATTPYNTDFWQNLFGYNQTGQPNMFVNQQGGFDFGAGASGLYDFLTRTMAPAAQQALLQGMAGTDTMAQEIYGGFPTGSADYMNQMLGQQGAEAENLRTAGFNYLWPFLDQLGPQISNLLGGQMPGTQTGAGGMANQTAAQLLGSGGQYGVQQLLNQIMQGGLPGQRSIEGLGGEGTIESLIGGQNLFGTGMQGETADRLMQALAGGGLTPEYVQAMREQVLQPSQEALGGQLNRQGGGVASNQSGLFQELQRRNERDFNNQLIQQGMGQYSNLLGQAGGMGQQGIGNALGAFGQVAGQAYPYIGLGGQLGSNLLGQGLQAGQLGLQGLNLANQMAYQPYLTGLGASGQTGSQALQMLNQYMGAGLGLSQNQQNFATQLLGQMGGQAGDILGGLTSQMAINQQGDMAGNASVGNLLGILAAIYQQSRNPNQGTGGTSSGAPTGSTGGTVPPGVNWPGGGESGRTSTGGGFGTVPVIFGPGGLSWPNWPGGGGGGGGGSTFDWNYYQSTGQLEDFLRWLQSTGALDEIP